MRRIIPRGYAREPAADVRTAGAAYPPRWPPPQRRASRASPRRRGRRAGRRVRDDDRAVGAARLHPLVGLGRRAARLQRRGRGRGGHRRRAAAARGDPRRRAARDRPPAAEHGPWPLSRAALGTTPRRGRTRVVLRERDGCYLLAARGWQLMTAPPPVEEVRFRLARGKGASYRCWTRCSAARRSSCSWRRPAWPPARSCTCSRRRLPRAPARTPSCSAGSRRCRRAARRSGLRRDEVRRPARLRPARRRGRGARAGLRAPAPRGRGAHHRRRGRRDLPAAQDAAGHGAAARGAAARLRRRGVVAERAHDRGGRARRLPRARRPRPVLTAAVLAGAASRSRSASRSSSSARTTRATCSAGSSSPRRGPRSPSRRCARRTSAPRRRVRCRAGWCAGAPAWP